MAAEIALSHESTPDSDVIGSRNDTPGAYHESTMGSKKVMYSFSKTFLSFEALAERSEAAFEAGASTAEGRFVCGLASGARPNAVTFGWTAARTVKNRARHFIVVMLGGKKDSSDLPNNGLNDDCFPPLTTPTTGG